MTPTPRQQKVLDLRAEGKSFADVASILGISVGAAKDHASAAKARLGQQEAPPKLTPRIIKARANEEAIYSVLRVTPLSMGDLAKRFKAMTPDTIDKAVKRMKDAGRVKSFGRGPHAIWGSIERIEHRALIAQVAAKEVARQKEKRRADRKRAERNAVANQFAESRPQKTQATVNIAPRAPSKPIIVPATKHTIIATPPSRYAPEPGYVRAITGDWALRRQGVEIESRFAGVY